MSQLLHLGEVVSRNARLFPNKLGARDLARSMTFRQWNERSCRLANALLGMGLAKGDRVAILAYNCVEWMEIYVALAKAGLVAVPINFRLVGPEIRYIVDDAEARAFIVQDDLLDRVEGIRSDLSHSPGQLPPFRRHEDAAGLSVLRGAHRPRIGERAAGAGAARGHLGVHVHLGDHRQTQRRHPQSRESARSWR